MKRDTKQGAPGSFKSRKFIMRFGKFVVIACVLALAGLLLVGCNTNPNPNPQPQPDNNKPAENKPTNTTDPTPSTTEDTPLKEAIASKVEGNVQYVTSSLNKFEYDAILVQEGIPVKWTLKASEADLTACNNSILIPDYGIKLDLVAGDNLIEFTPEKAGTYFFSCWMEMIYSYIAVADKDGNVPPVDWSSLPEGAVGSCCG